jgi:hypothetical protein
MNLLPPRADHDSFDVIDDALTELARRRQLLLGDELATIHLLASLADQAQRCLPEEVITARENGASWHQVATVLGVSEQEAWRRYDPASPTADGRWALDPDDN